MLRLFACALMLAPAVAGAQTPATPVPLRVPPPVAALPKLTPTPAAEAAALVLANTLNSEAMMRRQLERAYTIVLPAQMKQKPEIAQLEALYPGIADAAIAAERAYVEPYSIEHLPVLNKAIATVYATYLTEAEMQVIQTFYASPTGQKATLSAAEGSDLGKLIEKNLADPGGTTAASDLQAVATGGVSKFLTSLDDQDRKAMIGFSFSLAGRKWKQVQPFVFQATADYTNTSNQEIFAVAGEKVVVAMQDFIRDANAKSAKEGKAK